MAAERDGAAPLLFLVGATASGKKRLALDLAGRLPVELLSLDSMKVYRGMDRGTDKLAPGRFALTNLVDPSERFSTGAYVRAAQEAVAAIRARGRAPLFVGGTGLYLRALVRGLFEVPAISESVRRAVGLELDQRGAPALHAELAAIDPVAAARLHANDRKRIARALEVARETGRPLTEWQATSTRRPIAGRPHLVGLRWPREELRRRIVARIDRMFADGLVEEVAALRASGSMGPVAGLAIGYREVVEMLERGGSLEECRAAVITDTWTFVRRQENWLRQFPEIGWIDAGGDEAVVAARAESSFREALAAD